MNVGSHTCTPPELLSVSTGFSGGTEEVTFQLQWDSIGDWYQQNVDPNTRMYIYYNYQDGNGWLQHNPNVPFVSLTDYPIIIAKKIGFLTVQFKMVLITNSECGSMESNVLQNNYT